MQFINLQEVYMSTLVLTEVKQKIQSATYEEQISILSFIEDLLKTRNHSQDSTVKSSVPERKLGGLEKGFWIADDFDETPECFKDYI